MYVLFQHNYIDSKIIIMLFNHVYCTSRLGKVHCPIVALVGMNVML